MILYLQNIFLAALAYTLGASAPAHLGAPFNALAFWLGLVSIALNQTGMFLLAEVFRPRNEPFFKDQPPQRQETLRNAALYASIAALASSAFLIYFLYAQKILAFSALLVYLASFALILFYAVPPMRLLQRGLGEAALAAHLAYIAPAIGFLLQFKAQHLLLILIATPLTALALSYLLVVNFATFAQDEFYQRATLLRQMTWERAAPLHHALLAFAYVFWAISIARRFSMLKPALFTLPFAALQIILVQRVTRGAKPNWNLLAANAAAVFGLTAYFITLNIWIR